jgi:hypothetical protein
MILTNIYGPWRLDLAVVAHDGYVQPAWPMAVGSSCRGPRRLHPTTVEVPQPPCGRPPIAVGHDGWSVNVVAYGGCG